MFNDLYDQESNQLNQYHSLYTLFRTSIRSVIPLCIYTVNEPTIFPSPRCHDG